MKVREVLIPSGEKFVVPQGIQRIDTKSTHGWQVRYQGTKMFSDHTQDVSGAKRAFAKATRELLARIATLPAPVALQRSPSEGKTSGLPPGISGPIIRTRTGTNVRTANLSVLLPQFGKPPKCATVYIGNENTYTPQRYKQALAKAIELRKSAQEKYEVSATRAKRRAALAMRAAMRQGASRQ